MANTPERKVKDKVTALLRGFGAYYFFPPANGFGRSGIPDIIACYRGQFLAIECKAGKNTATRLQLREIDYINKAGGIALVVNEHNITEIEQILSQLEKHHDREDSKGTTT